VNAKALYAAGGGIAAAAIAIFFIMGPGNIRLPGMVVGNQTSQQLQLEPELSIRNITATRMDNASATVRVTFDMYNPNQSPLLLEALQYTLTVGGFRMTVGDIGGSPEGFVASSADLTQIQSKNSVPLTDIQVVTRNNLNADSWDSMVKGTAHYQIEGFYSYRTNAMLETTTGEKDFTLTFP
jgi:LEA14-like dessication related protein